MTRIVCKTPSSGRPIRFVSNNVTTTFTTLITAPDFSVPDQSRKFPNRDPLDAQRAIRPGEIFFLTPIMAKNNSAEDRWVEVQYITEEGTTISVGRVEVPAGDTVFIPIQGRSLLKRDPVTLAGDALQVRAEVSGIFDIWGAAEERLANEHQGVE